MDLPVPTNDWAPVFEKISKTKSYQDLCRFVEDAYQKETVYPPKNKIFQAFQWTPYAQVKVVLIGQDPYHGPGQAHGLSFSVETGVKIPPSLRNIYQELAADIGVRPVEHGNLEAWARQGVLLLNRVLTVAEGSPSSHQGKGWEEVTDVVIDYLNEREKPVIFVLWGKQAERLSKRIDEKKHSILTGPHPSPLSAYRGFFGSKPFSKINQLLLDSGQEPITWQLPEKL